MTSEKETSQYPERNLRLFFAVEISEEIRAKVADLRARLQKAAHFTPLRATWVPPQNYHITLYFLGDLTQKKAGRLVEHLPLAAEGMAPFTLDFRKLGFFPPDGPKPPRVLWLGVHRPPEALAQLRRNCATVIRAAGLPIPGQDFSPHLTLARFRSTKGLSAFRRQLREYEHVKAGTCEVGRVVLMQSITGGGPARYEPYATANFSAPERDLHTDVAHDQHQPREEK